LSDLDCIDAADASSFSSSVLVVPDGGVFVANNAVFEVSQRVRLLSGEEAFVVGVHDGGSCRDEQLHLKSWGQPNRFGGTLIELRDTLRVEPFSAIIEVPGALEDGGGSSV